jgi:methylglyoxal synthase
VNSIPYATNLATAEVLVLAIDRGDLDWRKLIR